MSNSSTHTRSAWFIGAAACVLGTPVHAQLIVNGGFESGFTGWTRADQLGSDGTFHSQTGTSSPINGFAVPAPPEGAFAAMTDSGAGGSHVLYQDFVVPAGPITLATVSFALYLNNAAGTYSNPATLDWATPTLNQQARADLLSSSADAFSVAGADVIQNLFQTTTSTPAVTGYTSFSIDITAALQGREGQTVRLRFAEADNVNFFNFGVDNVSVVVIPAPSALALLMVLPIALKRRARQASPERQ